MKDITVIGSINMDIFATSDHYPRRGETIFGNRTEVLPGGKGASQAIACARLNKNVNFIGSVGKDAYGQDLIKHLNDNGINTKFIKQVESQSSGTVIVTIDASGENTMLVIKGANDELDENFIEEALSEVKTSKMLLIQMEIPTPSVIHAMQIARGKDMFIFLDPAPAQGISKEALQYADLIAPNLQETKHLTGIDVIDKKSAHQAAVILENNGVKNSIIKMAEKGSLIYESGITHFIPALNVKAVDTVGAGDCFAGAVASALTDGQSLLEAVRFATIASGLKVTKVGGQKGIPTLDELNAFCFKNGLSHYLLNNVPASDCTSLLN